MKREVKFFFLILLISSFMVLTGCFWDDDDDNYVTTGGGNRTVSNSKGTAIKGNLANATVEIYEIKNDGSKVLRWTETTSSGTTLGQIGKFNTHSGELDPNKFYLYKITGGIDWDKDDDGVYDPEDNDPNCPNGTPNKGTIRAVLKGDEVKNIGDKFKVTAISELVYEKVGKYIGRGFDPVKFKTKLEQTVTEILSDDVNGDGKIDITDVVEFHPAKPEDKNKVQEIYRKKIKDIAEIIHEGKTIIGNLTPDYGKIEGIGEVTDIAIFTPENKAYLAVYSDDKYSIKVLDISDDMNPEIIGEITCTDLGVGSLDSISLNLSPDGKYLYLFANDNEFYMVDVSNLDSLQVKTVTLGNSGDDYSIESICVSKDGNRVYLGGKKWSNPPSPVIVVVKAGNLDDFSIIKEVINPIDELGTDVSYVQVSLDGNRLYLIIKSDFPKIGIFDISNAESENPTLSLTKVYELRELTSGFNSVFFDRLTKKFYLAVDNGEIVVFDVSDLMKIVKKESLFFNNLETVESFVLDKKQSKIYVGTSSDFVISSISLMKGNLMESDYVFTDEAGKIVSFELFSDGKKAAILTEKEEENNYNYKLQILDISSTPYVIEKSGNIDVSNEILSAKIKISKDENKLYLIYSLDNFSDLISIFDISSLSDSGDVQAVAQFEGDDIFESADGTRLYIFREGSGFSVKSASDYSDIDSSYLSNINNNSDDSWWGPSVFDTDKILAFFYEEGTHTIRYCDLANGDISNPFVMEGICIDTAFFPSGDRVFALTLKKDSNDENPPLSLEVYAVNQNKIECIASKVIDELDLDSYAGGIYVSKDGKFVYLRCKNNEFKVLDLSSLPQIKLMPFSLKISEIFGENGGGLVISPEGELYFFNDNKIVFFRNPTYLK